MTEPSERDRAWHCAMRCLEYFDTYKIATIAPLAAEIAKEIAAAREEGRREERERCAAYYESDHVYDYELYITVAVRDGKEGPERDTPPSPTKSQD